MLFNDAAKIYVAGLRMGDRFFASPELRAAAIANGEWVHSTSEWLKTVSRELPDIPKFQYGLSVLGRFDGPSDRPFIPVMLPLEYIDTLSEQLANLAIARDARGRRPRAGKKIEEFFRIKIAGRDALGVPWNFSASYAVEQIAMRVLYASYYRGHLGEPSEWLDNELTNVASAISRELHRALTDPQPRAFERVFDRLAADVNKARADFDERRLK